MTNKLADEVEHQIPSPVIQFLLVVEAKGIKLYISKVLQSSLDLVNLGHHLLPVILIRILNKNEGFIGYGRK
jgi:hypothetical protein